MKFSGSLGKRILWHLAGLLALFAVFFVADYQSFQQRSGFLQASPYFFLLLLYGWIIFHNRILFDVLFLTGKKRAYFTWTTIALLVFSLNMHTILHYAFNVGNTLPQILNFWVYTLLGLGVHVLIRYLKERPKLALPVSKTTPPQPAQTTYFTYTADGEKHYLPCHQILFIESLENYVKVHTPQKTSVVRLAMKEAEELLPRPQFLRISRSHILNSAYVTAASADMLQIGTREFKIGKVYKKYVEEHLVLVDR